jgi:hypothetical protein
VDRSPLVDRGEELREQRHERDERAAADHRGEVRTTIVTVAH